MSRHPLAFAVLAGLAAASAAIVQAPTPAHAAAGPIPRPPLFFKEEWKQNAKGDEHPISQESVGDPNLELKLYGPTGKELKITGKAGDENNPIHVWSGECTTPCAAALRNKASYADLSGLARIRWNAKVSGFHEVRPIVKLADGSWLVGDKAGAATTKDWIYSEFNPADLRWAKYDPVRGVTTSNPLDKVDLSKVDEIGFADLMPSTGHGPGGWFDIGQFEVYAKSTPR